jgi:hypothetical protein
MWADEIDDPEYQDEVQRVAIVDPKDFFYQPITTFSRNILNAVTGEDTGYKIGSKDEYRFYVVMENDPFSKRDARRLYFDSPTQYEIATGICVSRQSRDRFQDNQKQFQKQAQTNDWNPNW